MQTIMEVVLEESEDVPENLLRIILSILGRDKEVCISFVSCSVFIDLGYFFFKRIEFWRFFNVRV